MPVMRAMVFLPAALPMLTIAFKLFRRFKILHKRTFSAFNIEHNGIASRSEFLLMMLDVMRLMLSTVAVTSLSAYSFISRRYLPCLADDGDSDPFT